MKEYVECKMVHNLAEMSLKMMGPSLIQSFEDEFEIAGGHIYSYEVCPEKETDVRKTNKYCAGKDKLSHLMQ